MANIMIKTVGCSRFGSVNERSSHHRVVSGQLHDAQTSTPRSRVSVKKLRKCNYYPTVTHINIGSRGDLFEIRSRARFKIRLSLIRHRCNLIIRSI
jgi:hypothetical protein